MTNGISTMIRQFVTTAAVLGSLLASTGVTAAAASPASVTNRSAQSATSRSSTEPWGNPWKVLAGRGTATGKCVGLANNGSTANGTRLIVWNCHYNTDQLWHGDYRWIRGAYRMTMRDWSNKCVGLANNGSTANGTRLVLWDCRYTPDQLWYLQDRGYSNGVRVWALRNEESGKCVGLANRGSITNGTSLILWDCHYSPDQLAY